MDGRWGGKEKLDGDIHAGVLCILLLTARILLIHANILTAIAQDDTDKAMFGAKAQRQKTAAQLSSLSLLRQSEARNLGLIIDAYLNFKTPSIISQDQLSLKTKRPSIKFTLADINPCIHTKD